jgi:hypothetical protein
VRGDTLDIDADAFVPHEDPPQHGQQRQLQHDGDDKMAEKRVRGGLHTPTGIKTHATRLAAKEWFEINGLRAGEVWTANLDGALLCQNGSKLPAWQKT